jgi:hypothetical protein
MAAASATLDQRQHQRADLEADDQRVDAGDAGGQQDPQRDAHDDADRADPRRLPQRQAAHVAAAQADGAQQGVLARSFHHAGHEGVVGHEATEGHQRGRQDEEAGLQRLHDAGGGVAGPSRVGDGVGLADRLLQPIAHHRQVGAGAQRHLQVAGPVREAIGLLQVAQVGDADASAVGGSERVAVVEEADQPERHLARGGGELHVLADDHPA